MGNSGLLDRALSKVSIEGPYEATCPLTAYEQHPSNMKYEVPEIKGELQSLIEDTQLQDEKGGQVKMRHNVCRPCFGEGVTPTVSRQVPGHDHNLTLLIQCEFCEGHGVVPEGEDRNFAHLRHPSGLVDA